MFFKESVHIYRHGVTVVLKIIFLGLGYEFDFSFGLALMLEKREGHCTKRSYGAEIRGPVSHEADTWSLVFFFSFFVLLGILKISIRRIV